MIVIPELISDDADPEAVRDWHYTEGRIRSLARFQDDSSAAWS